MAISVIYSLIMNIRNKDVLPWNHMEIFDFMADHLIDSMYEQEAKMKIEVIRKNNTAVTVVSSEEYVITDVSLAVDKLAKCAQVFTFGRYDIFDLTKYFKSKSGACLQRDLKRDGENF